jgi:hypothetical protein
MAIRVTCDNCGEHLSAPESHAGKAARCPACKQVIHVPAMYMLVPDRPPNTGLFDELYEGPVGAASSE